MKRYKRNAAILATFTVIGLAIGVIGPASADPPPFTEQWWNCPDNPGHVVYNPITGESIRVGHTDSFLNPGQPFWIWVCADTGGTAGSHSVGASGYTRPAMLPGYTQHTLVCPGVTTSSCVQTFTGVEVFAPDAGATGAKPRLSPAIAEHLTCVSVGVTPGSLIPVATSVTNPCRPTTTPGCTEICGVDVGGTCAVSKATVQTGGTAATVYVGSTPTPVIVPAVCVGTNRPGFAVVTAGLGTGC